jgi:AcrR family transcriptional regulator
MALKRTRRPRGSLTPDVILEAAERVAEQGFEGFSMRAVAARLEAVPMALYNHFATKEALVAALLDRVLGRFDAPPPTGDWLADLHAFAQAHRRLLAAHAWAVAPIFTNPNPGLSSVRIGELAMQILKRGGLSDREAVAAFSGLIAINYGWASFTAARDLDPTGPSHDVEAMLRQLPVERFPLTVATAAEWGRYGSDDDYEFVLGRFLDGLAK